jgi:hypothetical protein
MGLQETPTKGLRNMEIRKTGRELKKNLKGSMKKEGPVFTLLNPGTPTF